MSEVQVRTKGIKKATKSFTYEEVFAEYIWNGFDAKATEVNVLYSFLSDTERIDQIQIIDNGTGISFDTLQSKFSPFLESNKDERKKSENPIIKGENGYGRFTFYKFCPIAKWETTYENEGDLLTYDIEISSDNLKEFRETKPVKAKGHRLKGTIVTLIRPNEEIHKYFITSKLTPFLKLEFAWFLELNRRREFTISIKGEPISYSELILGRDTFNYDINDEFEKETYSFECEFVQWSQKLNDQYSCFYFIDTNNEVLFKKTTKFNNKSDGFYHSVFIRSELLDFFSKKEERGKPLIKRVTSSIYKSVFEKLESELNKNLNKKRKPLLKSNADKLIREYQKDETLPKIGNNEWDLIRRRDLEELIKKLYEVEPKIFFNLNSFQKKIMVRLLNQILDFDTRDDLFDILNDVVDLDKDEKKRIAEILKVTRLSSIIDTIELISDRAKTTKALKELVFNEDLKANEVDHLQSFIEQHFWIFGEQYNLVASAEDKFDKALKNFRKQIAAKYDEKDKIDHQSRLREMDIFLVRQSKLTESINNLVVELKHPSKRLKKEEYDQVKDYMSVICSEPRFNADTYSWTFYLIGKDYNEYIAAEIENSKNHGEKDLAFLNKNYKIYVKKWSDVINSIELRHDFLHEKLSIEKDKIKDDYDSVEELMESINKEN